MAKTPIIPLTICPRAVSRHGSIRAGHYCLITEKYHARRVSAKQHHRDLLNLVLAGRKHLGIDTLTNALDRIGYRIQIVPIGNGEKERD